MAEIITNSSIDINEGSWYIIYKNDDKSEMQSLTQVDEDGICGTIGPNHTCIVFENKEEGQTYIKENSILSVEDVINSSIEEDEAE